MIYNGNIFGFYPFLPPNCQKPPTIYSILESIVNGNVDLNDPAPDVKIKDLAKEGRTTIFNFDYPISENVSRETLETMILNHFLMRRIGFETVTAFRIQLNVKMNEIMPNYNKMFDALENWDIFNDGEKTERSGNDNTNTENINNSSNTLNNSSTTTSKDIADRRSSDTPQSHLEDIRNGSYVTKYSYDTNDTTSNDKSESSGTSNSNTNITDNKTYNETITRSPADKITILKEMQMSIKSIYSMIFDDLEVLFYGLV